MDPHATRPLREGQHGGLREPAASVLDRRSRDTRRLPVAPPAPRRPRVGDAVATILLLVVLAALAVLASFLGLLVALSADSCTTSTCLDWVGAGTILAVAAPTGCWTVALVGSIVAMVRRRRAVWIPLAGVMAWVGLVVVALALAGIGTEISGGL